MPSRTHRSEFSPRQYMLSADYEVFYYSDLHFTSVGTHAHDFYEFYFFVEGSVEMEIAGSRRALSPGDLIIVPPHVPHRAIIRDSGIPYRRYVLWMSRGYCDRIGSTAPDCTWIIRETAERWARSSYAADAIPSAADPRPERSSIFVRSFSAVEFNGIRSKLFSLLDELASDRFGRETLLSFLVADLLLHLSRLIHDRSRGAVRENARHYEAITAFIDRNLTEDLSLERLSQEFFLNKYTIAHLFTENVGLSVHQYIIKKRLAATADALKGGAAVSEAMRDAGFADYSSFYRAFRKEYGVSPSEYIEMYRTELAARDPVPELHT